MSEWRASVTVAAVIESDGRFLLVEEIHDGRRVLNQPAGHLDPGESLLDACVREVMEETAHRFVPEALLGVYRYVYAPKGITFLRFAFSGRSAGAEAGRALDAEIVRTHWLTREEIAARAAEHRTPLVMQCIEDHRAGRHFPLEVLSKKFS
ncbi:MAG: NUDIX hydrolase [Burkholderiales bacterium]|nr:NUDIX hydrolase [Burkholderiales bacterium]